MREKGMVITGSRARTTDRDTETRRSAGRTSDKTTPPSADPAGATVGEAAPAGPDAVRFQDSVVLSKGEVFGACQALADADRLLLKAGGKSEASALGDLFDLLEARLVHEAHGSDVPKAGGDRLSWSALAGLPVPGARRLSAD